jgi:hypothetical protein
LLHAEVGAWDGKNGAPPIAAQQAPAPNPEPDEERTLPGTPSYAAPSAPRPGMTCSRSSTATAAGSPARERLPVLHVTLVHVTVERLPDCGDPHRQNVIEQRSGT